MTGLKILAVDSHDLHWRRACEALNQDERFSLVCVVDSVDQALNCLAVIDPDVVMVDITLPGAVTMDVASRMQDGASRAMLIAATGNVDDASLSLAINMGARACVARDISPARLSAVISEVGNGGLPLEREVACRPVLLSGLLSEFQRKLRPAAATARTQTECPLTDRELTILGLVADGDANKEVAMTLAIAERTVKNHMANILDKLDARSRAHAVRMAVENTWICNGNATAAPAPMLELVA
ncbi:MAG: response regulator transcription factor [Chloroflexi bacterium]|nr:response regulator transcription factor [Chloroflexota bacterium]